MMRIVRNNRQEALLRITIMVILLANQILVWFGHNPLPFSDEQIFEGVSAVFMVIAVAWATWKNNNFSEEALSGQAELERLKEAHKNE